MESTVYSLERAVQAVEVVGPIFLVLWRVGDLGGGVVDLGGGGGDHGGVDVAVTGVGGDPALSPPAAL